MDSNLKPSTGVGTLQERSLHAALKAWYAQPGDRHEAPVDGFVIDLVRGDLLIEIQTRNFLALKDKLLTLTARHPVRLVYPIAQDKWIVRLAADGVTVLGRRRSPKRGRPEQVFNELIRFPQLLAHPNLTLELLLIQEEEVLCDDGRGSWRRKCWSLCDRRLLDVVGRVALQTPQDCAALLPTTLSEPFTNPELAHALGLTRGLAQKMTYCLTRMDMLRVVGRRGNTLLYAHPAQKALPSIGD